MQYLANLELVRKIASEIVRDRRCNYNEEQLIEYLSENKEVTETRLRVVNGRKNELLCSLFRKKGTRNHTCIVYLHGLGSNRLEVLTLLKAAGELPYDSCSFDFSGSGKSEGYFTSYGINESEDIRKVIGYSECIIDELTNKHGYTSFVLWGRSMGGVSAVLYQTRLRQPSVRCMVLDSPFYSFEQVALELASRRSIVPQFMIGVCLEPLKKCLEENYSLNPFSVSILDRIKEVDCPLLFVYSKNDDIVGHEHSMKLIAQCQRKPEQLEIQEDHNTIRTSETIEKVLEFLEKSLMYPGRRTTRDRSRGISLCSREGSRDRRQDTKKKVSPPRMAEILKTRISYNDAASEVSLPQRKSALKSVNSTDLNCRHPTSQSDFEFSPKIKERSKRLAYINSVMFESQRLPVPVLVPAATTAPTTNKQNSRATLNRLYKHRLMRKR